MKQQLTTKLKGNKGLRFKPILLFLLLALGINSSFGANYYVSNLAELKDALNSVKPGNEIILAPGTYTNNTTMGPSGSGSYFYVNVDGTADAPIVIRSEDPKDQAVIKGSRMDWLILMRILGDYWIVKDLKFTHGNKGLVFDNSNNSKAINCTFWDLGEEAVHVRDGSDNVVLDGLVINNVGKENPSVGEGIYVGTDKGNWGTGAKDYKEDVYNTEIRNCILGPNIAAECIDIKEGSKNTIVENCVFDATGISGKNSADSYIDVKGAEVVIRFNKFYSNNAPNFTEGVACYHRGESYQPTGTKVVVHDNEFDFDGNTSQLMVFKTGSVSEVYAFNNKRVPASEDEYSHSVNKGCPTWYNGCGKNYTLTTSAVNGFVNPKEGRYVNGQQLELYPTPNAGYEFDYWSGDLSGSDNPAKITIDNNKNVTAHFKLAVKSKFTLTTVATNGTVTPDGGEFNAKSAVVLTAAPNPGYEFTGWTGDITSSENPLTLLMDSDKNVTANFTEISAVLLTVCDASDNGNDGNGPNNVLDNDLNTRWASKGDNKWISFDLCKSYNLELIRLAWYKGDQRSSTFDIQVSEDGTSWTDVLTATTSSGSNLQLETFRVAGAKGRYVRYVGHGNNSNEWNSVTECEIYAVGDGKQVPVTGIDLNPSTLSVKIGETGQLNYGILPSNATNKGVKWRSAEPGIASVSNGTVKGEAVGTTTIFIKTNDGGFEKSCEVTVTNDPVAVESVSVSPSTLSLKIDNNSTLSATVNPGNATNKKVTWSSSNTSVATVDENTGEVTAKVIGEATITATTDDGGFESTCVVTVTNDEVYVKSVEVTPSTITLSNGAKQTLSVAISPENATNKKVTWKSNNKSIVTVDELSGELTALNEGAAIITATTDDGGFEASCEVTVAPAGACDFGIPGAPALTDVNTTWKKIYVVGIAPNMTNVKKFSINWNQEHKGLYKFAVNTTNGKPGWYVDLRENLTHSLGSKEPYISLSGTDVMGFDGDFLVNIKDDNFVMARKDGSYTLIFSNSDNSPCENATEVKATAAMQDNFADAVKVYPNPVGDVLTIDGTTEISTLSIYSLHGALIKKINVNSIDYSLDCSALTQGAYYVKIDAGNEVITKKFIKK